MKKIFFSAASAALLLLTGCQREQLPVSPQGPGEFVKTISVSLGDPSTRAASALSGEGAIEDATLFVWQHNASTDETVLYQKAYAASSSFEFSLLFSDQTDYTYSINAWANMGELSAEPGDGDVLFTGESASGLQMKGSKGSIDESSSSAVTIDMKRYVGKITVAEVALEWTNAQNALQEFTLKSIYVANAGDKAEGAVATYNVDGAYVSSSMDALLYSPVNSVIADGGKYETAQMMYAYGSGSTALVLECELGGQTMYYHVPYEPGWNTHRVFRFTVRQAGSDDPLGELPEEAIETSVVTLNVLDWDADEQDEEFGEAGSGTDEPVSNSLITQYYNITSSQTYSIPTGSAQKATIYKVLEGEKTLEETVNTVPVWGSVQDSRKFDYSFETLGSYVIELSDFYDGIAYYQNSDFLLCPERVVVSDCKIQSLQEWFSFMYDDDILAQMQFNLKSVEFNNCDFAPKEDNILCEHYYAFSSCPTLESVRFYNCNFKEGAHDFLDAFIECTSLKRVEFIACDAQGDILFNNFCFARCSSLQTLDLDIMEFSVDGGISLSSKAFIDCSNLSEIIMKGNVYNEYNHIEDGVFDDLPENGYFYYTQGYDCSQFTSHLPSGWVKTTGQ